MNLHEQLQAVWNKPHNDAMLIFTLSRGGKNMSAEDIAAEVQQLTEEQKTKIKQILTGLTGSKAVAVSALLQ